MNVVSQMMRVAVAPAEEGESHQSEINTPVTIFPAGGTYRQQGRLEEDLRGEGTRFPGDEGEE